MTDDWSDLLAAATTGFADALSGADPSATVPSCPGWTVADLVDHLGGVHQWSRHAVLAGNPDGRPEAATGDLLAWYRRHADDLLATLRTTDPGAPAWTFGTEQSVGWWLRRQTHETLMHTRDLLGATGRVEHWTVEPTLAWDGVREVATEFYPRQVRLGRAAPLPGTLRLLATDLPGAEVVLIGDAEPVVEVRAQAVDLLLMLWHRTESSDPAAAALLGLPIAP
ncbi:maleylpyruvate isomerase family mycothiol-dependent enzyme [Nocardioides sp. URHA0020]|uniref:maleylpyruvate isomerase family mycothiol-dependent enzyme n=1 Tax=Nocardioides sp. URHA0020 TaxID=1380392 RepID=UPI000685D9B9|nr:maleylpyruvate isomerase family mycothiol-dependent enzyme [Nocardioides sp. URHA0020]